KYWFRRSRAVLRTFGRLQRHQDLACGTRHKRLDGHLVQSGEERLLRPTQLPTQPTGRPQRTRRIVLAGHDVATALQLPDDRADPRRTPRLREPQPAATPPPRLHQPHLAQPRHHLGGVRVGDGQHPGHRTRGEHLLVGDGQTHHDAQRQIGEGGQTHATTVCAPPARPGSTTITTPSPAHRHSKSQMNHYELCHDGVMTASPVLLVATNGGHPAQLWPPRPWWHVHERFWVTLRTADLAAREPSAPLPLSRRTALRRLTALLDNTLTAVRVFTRHRPAVVVSTGARDTLPFLLLARLLRVPTLPVEVHDRVTT